MALSRGNIKYNSRNIQFVPNTTAAAIYINPATTKTYIKGFIIFNGATTVETVNLYFVEDNLGALDTLDVASKPQQFLRQELASGETFYVELNYPIVLTDENDAIFGLTDSSQKVTIITIGDVET
tara:strand:+ start:39333 stop:39707 length:375 start_codon:yes stop_codon:yes gene_type:complete